MGKTKQQMFYSTEIKQIINSLEEALKEYNRCYNRVNDIDYLTQDYLHKLELEDLNYASRAKIATTLSKLRKERRIHKDKVEVLEPLIVYLTSDRGKTAINLLKEVLGKMRKAEEHHQNRVYINKRLEEN